MEFGICTHSVIPVRAEPSHKAEMTSEILFGELYRMVEKADPWIRIQLAFDNYEGWISASQAALIGEPEFIRLSRAETPMTTDLVQIITNESRDLMIPVVMGTSLPGISGERLQIAGEDYQYEGSLTESASQEDADSRKMTLQTRKNIVDTALLYLNAPYRWGGRSPFGIDCSGLVQMAFKLNNIRLLRDAGQQATQGEVVSLPGESEPADLVFFDDEEGKIVHVGILADRHHVIHCSGMVRLDPIDHEGIYNAALQRYTHKLRLIKRLI